MISIGTKEALASHELILLELTPSSQLAETVICFVLFCFVFKDSLAM